MKFLKNSYFVSVLVLGSLIAVPALGYKLPSNKDQVDSNKTAGLRELSKGLNHIALSTKEALVFISISKEVKQSAGQADLFEFFFGPQFRDRRRGEPQRPAPRQQGLGSGFFVDLQKGYIVTNNHVVEGADEISLKLANDKTYEGKVVGRDSNTDIAVVQVIDKDFTRKGLQALSFETDEDLSVGEFVAAMGAPFGLEASLSFGIVSAVGRGNLQITQLGNFIQTDAAINPGNSGGPLVSTNGKVVGVNTAIYSKSGGYNGIGFAVPASLAKKVTETLISDGKIDRGFIGVGMLELTDDLKDSMGLSSSQFGVVVRSVEPNGPARSAGVKAGDLITAVNGKPIRTPSDLSNSVGLMRPKDKATVSIIRDGKKKSIKLTIGYWPGSEEGNSTEDPEVEEDAPFGLTVAPKTSQLAREFSYKSKQGVIVASVIPGSPAAAAGLEVGDLIVSAKSSKIKSVSQFNKIASKLEKSKKTMILRVERDGQFMFVPVRGR